jgi:hypothetical protein
VAIVMSTFCVIMYNNNNVKMKAAIIKIMWNNNVHIIIME